MVSPTQAYAAASPSSGTGANGIILRTTDRGVTWSLQFTTATSTQSIYSLSMMNAYIGTYIANLLLISFPSLSTVFDPYPLIQSIYVTTTMTTTTQQQHLLFVDVSRCSWIFQRRSISCEVHRQTYQSTHQSSLRSTLVSTQSTTFITSYELFR